MKKKVNMMVDACSKVDEDCPFFKCYERGTCYHCECMLDGQDVSEYCIDCEADIPSRPDDCKLNEISVTVKGRMI